MKEYRVEVDESGVTRWYKPETTTLHRENGPAIEFPNGHKEWWVNGKPHRKDGPAIEFPNGHKEWWVNGEPHREDGPAIEFPDGSKKWYLNGKRVTEEEFLATTSKISCDGKVVEIEGKKYRLVKVEEGEG